MAVPSSWKTLEGVVSVNAQGCYSIGSALIWAPPHSQVDSDGRGITLAGYGDFGLGDSISIVGALVRFRTATSVDPVAKTCGAGQNDVEVASLYPHRMTATASP